MTKPIRCREMDQSLKVARALIAPEITLARIAHVVGRAARGAGDDDRAIVATGRL
jgi:hypothetical protein